MSRATRRGDGNPPAGSELRRLAWAAAFFLAAVGVFIALAALGLFH